jgi:WD40 repeat protein
MAMACHASGGLLATAGADKKVCVWDVDGGFCTHFFRGHTGIVTTIMFHKDPKRLLVSIILQISNWSYFRTGSTERSLFLVRLSDSVLAALSYSCF